VRDTRALIAEWDVFIKLLSPRLRYLCRRGGKEMIRARGGAAPRRQHLPDTTGLIVTWTHIDCVSMLKTCTSSNQTKPRHWEGKVDTKPLPDQEAICKWYLVAFWGFFLFFFVFCFFCFVLFCFFVFWEIEHEVGTIGNWGRSERSCGRKKNDKNILIKMFLTKI